MLWDGSGYHHVCAWECVGRMLLYLFQLLTQVLLRLLAGYCCAQVTHLHSQIVFTQYLGIRHEAKHSIMHFIQQQQKYTVFTGVAILIIYVPQRTEFVTLYLEITCVYYILLDNRDLQSCQVGQGKDVAITTPAQSTFCVLGHQAFPRLASGPVSMWHTSTRGVLIKEEFSDLVLIARKCVSAQYLECTASSYYKLGFKYPSPEHNLEAFRLNYKPMKLQLSVPELPTSAPYVCDNEGLGKIHTERTFECQNGLKSHNYDPPGK